MTQEWGGSCLHDKKTHARGRLIGQVHDRHHFSGVSEAGDDKKDGTTWPGAIQEVTARIVT